MLLGSDHVWSLKPLGRPKKKRSWSSFSQKIVLTTCRCRTNVQTHPYGAMMGYVSVDIRNLGVELKVRACQHSQNSVANSAVGRCREWFCWLIALDEDIWLWELKKRLISWRIGSPRRWIKGPSFESQLDCYHIFWMMIALYCSHPRSLDFLYFLGFTSRRKKQRNISHSQESPPFRLGILAGSAVVYPLQTHTIRIPSSRCNDPSLTSIIYIIYIFWKIPKTIQSKTSPGSFAPRLCLYGGVLK